MRKRNLHGMLASEPIPIPAKTGRTRSIDSDRKPGSNLLPIRPAWLRNPVACVVAILRLAVLLCQAPRGDHLAVPTRRMRPQPRTGQSRILAAASPLPVAGPPNERSSLRARGLRFGLKAE